MSTTYSHNSPPWKVGLQKTTIKRCLLSSVHEKYQHYLQQPTDQLNHCQVSLDRHRMEQKRCTGTLSFAGQVRREPMQLPACISSISSHSLATLGWRHAKYWLKIFIIFFLPRPQVSGATWYPQPMCDILFSFSLHSKVGSRTRFWVTGKKSSHFPKKLRTNINHWQWMSVFNFVI